MPGLRGPCFNKHRGRLLEVLHKTPHAMYFYSQSVVFPINQSINQSHLLGRHLVFLEQINGDGDGDQLAVITVAVQVT